MEQVVVENGDLAHPFGCNRFRPLLVRGLLQRYGKTSVVGECHQAGDVSRFVASAPLESSTMTRLSTRDRSCRSGSRWRYPPGLLLGSWVAGLNSAVHFPFSSLAARIPRARHHRHCRAATELVTGGRGYPAACERSFDAVAVNPEAPHHNPRPSSTRPTPHPALCPGSAGPSTFMSINSSPGHCHVKLVEIAQWRCWFWSCIDGSAWGYRHFRRQCRAR